MPPPKGKPRCFLAFDIGDDREAYERAEAFVEATDLRYGFSSKKIEELGGSERARVPELYESDFEWSQKGRCSIEKPDDNIVTFELNAAESPLACENFLALCSGEKGTSTESGKALCYKGTACHRCVKGFVMQGGDIQFGNGTGGESIWGKKFKDDKGGLKLKHGERGVLSMGNSGKNSNSSQFFIAFGPAKALDGKHVVFGKVVGGEDVLDRLEEQARGDPNDETPAREIVIRDCGLA